MNLIQEILKIKEYIIRLGTISYNHHYENGFLTIFYVLKQGDESVSLGDSDLKFTITILFDGKYKGEFYRLMIDFYKVSERHQLKGLTENFRGDYQEVLLDSEMLEDVLQEFQRFIGKTNAAQILREKILDSFITSAKKILTTDTVYQENRAQYGKYPNGGAFISVSSKTNKNILDRLNKYPIALDWIDVEYIRDYGFDKVIDLIEFITTSNYFRSLHDHISQTYCYEPSVFMRNNKLYFGCNK